MRLWHKDLIPYLPRQQLLGQWRECCAIARSIDISHTPNHILVNKILDYPEAHFNRYAWEVHIEMQRRGYNCRWWLFEKWRINRCYDWELNDIFNDWHNDRYLVQCLCNLQEKYDCGGISENEWMIIASKFGDEMRFCP